MMRYFTNTLEIEDKLNSSVYFLGLIHLILSYNKRNVYGLNQNRFLSALKIGFPAQSVFVKCPVEATHYLLDDEISNCCCFNQLIRHWFGRYSTGFKHFEKNYYKSTIHWLGEISWRYYFPAER